MQGDVILMGPPGVGKGTQAHALADRNGWLQLATGDLFRDHVRRRTELGVLADGYISKGAYVPDEITIGIVRERLREIGPGRRVMFDGFPRTVAQAEALDGLLAETGRLVGRVLLIDVPEDVLLSRVAGRAKVDARADDSPEVVRKRFQVYRHQTEPVIALYERRGLLRRVDGVGPVAEITDRLVSAAG